MSNIASRAVRYAAYAVVVAVGFTATIASAQATSSTDLGKAWPNAQDLSSNPNWHAYAFERNGVRYIQINDRNGTVHAAIGLVGNTAFSLPMGVDAQSVTEASSLNAGAATEVIYQDDAVNVAAVTQDDGVKRIVTQVKATCSDPAYCTQGNIM